MTVRGCVMRNLLQDRMLYAGFWQDPTLMAQFFDALPVAVAYYNRDLVFELANPAYARWTKRAAEEIIGKHFFEVFPGTEATVGNVLRQVLDSGEPFHHNRFCFVYEEASGTEQTYWDVRHLPRFDAEGRVIGILTIAANLTNEIDLQEEVLERTRALDESERQFRGIFAESTMAIALIDLEGRLQEVNRAWQAMVGRGQAQLRGRPLDEFLEPADLTFARLMAWGERGEGGIREVRLRDAEGQLVWGRLGVTLNRDSLGAPRFVTCMVEDVTALKVAEAARYEATRELETVMESVPDLLYVLDLDGRLVRWNAPLVRVTGRPAEELDHLDALELFVPEDRAQVAEGIERAHARGYAEAEGRLMTGDGQAIPYHFTGVPFKDRSGRVMGLAGMGRDISELKRRDDLLRSQVQRLAELNRLKSDFVSTVTHELRAPLTTILGYAEFLEDEFGGPLSDEQRKFVHQIEASSRRLDYLISDLLDSARLEAETFRLHVGLADFTETVREITESLEPQLQAARLAIELDLPPDPMLGRMDAKRVGQVLFNLLTNAIKFSAPGTRIRLSAQLRRSELTCRIQDEGPGIASEDIPRLFQRFSQLESGKQRRGTGLGLSISKAIVEAHGGTIGVDSRPGAGSTFWFTLPIA